jgi:hypothetical protein
VYGERMDIRLERTVFVFAFIYMTPKTLFS